MYLLDIYKGCEGKYKVSHHLLWEYDMEHFDWNKSRRIVVQRVIERGRPEDYCAIFDLYGYDGVRNIIKELSSLSPIDMNFVCKFFNIRKKDLKCYTRKRFRSEHLVEMPKKKNVVFPSAPLIPIK